MVCKLDIRKSLGRISGASAHLLVHEYFSIDIDIVWQTASRDLVPLRAQIEEILMNEFPGGTTSE